MNHYENAANFTENLAVKILNEWGIECKRNNVTDITAVDIITTTGLKIDVQYSADFSAYGDFRLDIVSAFFPPSINKNRYYIYNKNCGILDNFCNKYGCQIVKHHINLGQGRAFKSGFNYFLGKYLSNDDIIGIIECDCDGQHILEDVNACAELLRKHPEDFIIGTRDFSSKNVPFRSRFGNKVTSFIFKVFCGLNITDTQTGLKGIPKAFISRLMETPGERFEYASSVLLETKKAGLKIVSFPIHTIYIDGNKTSHFNPLLDSIRIYSLIIKSFISSMSASVIDLLLFWLFVSVTKNKIYMYVMLSTYLAKIISCAYSYLVNKNLVFENRERGFPPLARWIILCILQATISGMLTFVLFLYIKIPEIA